jgi:DNA invertase Pin-like site-specific DNA recombinase
MTRLDPARKGRMTLSDKVQGRHLDRLAMVYVRQSTLQQVERHKESTRLQYGLVERAVQLGWSEARIVMIDDDQGRSGAAAVTRPGFQRLVAEVGLGRVGIVLGIEMSRLARSCRDWYQLIENCAMYGTLLADTDGVYDPATYNDRLLLGLKGTMSEAELHILKSRMQAGRCAKAERGELAFLLPRGYVRDRCGAIAIDPDEQVQSTIRLIFDVFERRRTVNGVLTYLVEHDIKLPHRIRSGAAKGELEWHRPSRWAVSEMLHSPIYAGAYAYGRRCVVPPRHPPGPSGAFGRSRRSGAATVLLKDRLPAYISWATFERNQAQMAANRSEQAGIPRGGPTLLAGLLICGRCGRRMAARYRDHARFPRYACNEAALKYGEPLCQSLSTRALDALVAELILAALEPAALEVSLQLAEDLKLDRTQHHRNWQQRLERPRTEAERARRQYDAVEPENRLVARTLERHWEETLAEELRTQAAYEKFLVHQPLPLTAADKAAIRRLAADVPALWTATTTAAADRQAIARLMLERVTVTVAGQSEQVAIICRWAGGTETHHDLQRLVARLSQLSNYTQLVQRIIDLHTVGTKPSAIAETLNAEGWKPAKRRGTFTAAMVQSLLRRNGVPVTSRRSWTAKLDRQDPTELTIDELAARLDMPQSTLCGWVRRGLVPARKARVSTHGVWLIQADEATIEHLRSLHVQTIPNPSPDHES